MVTSLKDGHRDVQSIGNFYATFRKPHDFIMYVSSQRSLLHLLVISADAPIADVVLDGVIEKDGILRNHADVGSQ